MRKPRVRSPFFLPALEARAPTVWQPQVDIYRAQEGWVVKMELAGVRPQDVSIAVCGARLRVSGVRHDRIVEVGWSHYAMEIAYNHFERRFPRSEILQQSGMRRRSFSPENRRTCHGKVDRFILPSE